MLQKNILICCVLFVVGVKSSISNISKKNFIYNVYNYDKVITLTVNETTEQILDFNQESDEWSGYPTRVHVSSNGSISENHPLFITAIQQKGVSSWEMPLVIRTAQATMRFKDMARTLCPHDAGPNITTVNSPLIQLATSHPDDVVVNIKLRRVRDFYVEVNKELNTTVTPSQPKYYYFSFDRNPWNVTKLERINQYLPILNYTIPKSVLLMVESDNELCAVVSIQNNSCPVFDNEQEMLYQGYHLTMSGKGGITLTQTMYPHGFYIVFIVKQSDEECIDNNVMPPLREVSDLWEVTSGVLYHNRSKTFRFRVVATISYTEYATAAGVLVAITVLAAVLVVLLMLPFRITYTQEVIIEDAPVRAGAGDDAGAVEEEVPIVARSYNRMGSNDSSASVDGESMPPLNVAALNRIREQQQLQRSNRYFWSALTVAVVYALPVVQLLFTYQQMVFQTGNQDLCYYNFLCAHPLGMLSDFNHVYSNVAYVILGFVFMFQTWLRQRDARNAPQDKGIPQHHGLFYTMGVSLVMEGLLSGCYHLCPNKMNFQFDSSFMYVIAVVCMVKLYQNRHPDVNASAHATFMLIAVVMMLGVIGIVWPTIYFRIVFTALHLSTCLVLTLKIYYVGRFKLERAAFRRARDALRARGRRACVPGYKARAVLLAIANIANWALAFYGLYDHNTDFARLLLGVLMGNTILYTLFYVTMKIVHRERIPVYAWLYFVFAHVAWFTALKYFTDSRTKWSQTPAQSRQHNAVCNVLQFYDTHDVWHLASAAALFLSFNLLLTVDDALAHTPRTEIPVF